MTDEQADYTDEQWAATSEAIEAWVVECRETVGS
jgi:hypothetical protein